MTATGGSDARARLVELGHALRSLHKALIATAQATYEKQYGRVAGPGALLRLLLDDPWFAWLRPMSTLIAELDERTDDQAPIEAAEMAERRATVERLLTGPGAFGDAYREVLQNDPHVIVEHAAVRKLLT
jgi:hypothetical protein